MLRFSLDTEIDKTLELVTTGNAHRPLEGACAVSLAPILRVLVLFDKFTKSLRCNLIVDTWIEPGLVLYVNIVWYLISLHSQ